MTTFGEQLRRERELRGVTLPELASATKIGLRYLTAFEADRMDQLPGGVFNRGFVRAIARYLRLDEHHWVGEYVRAAGEEPEVLARYAPPPNTPASSRRSAASFLLLVVSFGAGAYLVHDLRLRRAAEASRPVEPIPASSHSTPVPSQPASQISTLSAQPLPSSPPSIRSAFPAVPMESRATDLRLQVDALEEAWVAVTLDGEGSYQGLLQSGETRTFRAGRLIELTTGNASAVILTLNGETLAPLGNPRERKSIRLTSKDIPSQTP